MKKLITMMMLVAIFAIGASFKLQAQSTTIMGVPLDMPASEFKTQLSMKANGIAKTSKSKKCKIEVNEELPKETIDVCYVDIELEYSPTESNSSYAMIRSILNSKYGESYERTVMLPIHKQGLFWETPYGEVALTKISDSVIIRIFNYQGIKTTYNGITELF